MKKIVMEQSTTERGSGDIPMPFSDKLVAVFFAVVAGLAITFLALHFRRRRLLAMAPTDVTCHACRRKVRYVATASTAHVSCPYCKARITLPDSSDKKPEQVHKEVKNWGGALRKQRDERRRRPGTA
jgi:hypothetical protein